MGFRQVAALQQSERLAERRAAQQLHEARLEMAETRRQQEILSLEMQEAVPGMQICFFFPGFYGYSENHLKPPSIKRFNIFILEFNFPCFCFFPLFGIVLKYSFFFWWGTGVWLLIANLNF